MLSFGASTVDLPRYVREPTSPRTGKLISFPRPLTAPGATDLELHQQEQRAIEQALDRARGNQVHAARLLGISGDKLRYKLKKQDLAHGFALHRTTGSAAVES